MFFKLLKQQLMDAVTHLEMMFSMDLVEVETHLLIFGLMKYYHLQKKIIVYYILNQVLVLEFL